MNLKVRLTVMNFLEFAVWGAYLTSMGKYLEEAGMATNIGWFYSVQGIVSLFMPALVGIVADRWMQGQRVLSLCHMLAGLFMLAACYYGYTAGNGVEFSTLFSLYTMSVAFFMPTLGLANSVAYYGLDGAGLDTVKHFPPIRVFGTIGFICSMWVVDLCGMQDNALQFGFSGLLGIVLAFYSLTLPACPVAAGSKDKSLADTLGLRAFALFRQKRMAIFFVFSMLLGVCLQITNGFANPFISAFGDIETYKDTFGVQHANILISLSQFSETCCILLIPFFLSKFGIKRVMLIAMLAWVLRFGFFAMGNPGGGVWMFLLSMIVYGVAFDFFNISGSLFVDKETDLGIRSSAQGLFVMMTNGFGATIGTLSAQVVINHFVYELDGTASADAVMAGWSMSWYVFAAYALVVAVLFALVFRYKHVPEAK
ncbi:MAG: MFS transporter [Clostridium sp.]|nr:MFS transporter [Clostridium sp.]